MVGKSAPEHFLDEVRSGKCRETHWGIIANVVFPAATPEESWEQLQNWARDNGVQVAREKRFLRNEWQVWVRFGIKRAP